MHGITDDEMLDRFVCGLEPIIGREVLKENPQSFEEACVLSERILQIANLVEVVNVVNGVKLQIMLQCN